MATFLDLRTSQGTSSTVLPAGTPVFVGSIGLIVDNASNIRVDLSGSVGVDSTLIGNITVFVLRNIPASVITTTFNAANTIYTQSFNIQPFTSGTTTTLTFNAADFHPTASLTEPGQINYSLWVVADTAGNTLKGIQSFTGIAAAS